MFQAASGLFVPGARVPEIGYNTGLMACYLARTFDVHVTGYEVRPEARSRAVENALWYGVSDRTDFRMCSPDNTLGITGCYDIVFLKSVLFHLHQPDEYRRWLRWIQRRPRR